MSDKPKKRFFAKHAKSSAFFVSLVLHGILIMIAVTYVAVTVVMKDEQQFEAKRVDRPKQPLKKLRVPVKVTKRKPKPKMRKTLVSKVDRKVPEFQMPEIAGVPGGVGAMEGGSGIESIGFSMPEIDFFGAKAKGEKICFIVHFGPATIGDNPFTRMTGFTIRKRLEDMVSNLPAYALFNVAAYWAVDTWAMNPSMMIASEENKRKVLDWMAPVNPLEGNYNHCFDIDSVQRDLIKTAEASWPTKVEAAGNLPFYSPSWIYPYEVPDKVNERFVADSTRGEFWHWNRAVTWALLTQKPDTIFILTTNYIDPWKVPGGGGGQPSKMTDIYKKMMAEIYGPDRKKWPTISVVVLARENARGTGSDQASKVLNEEFGPIWKTFKGEGSIIDDISDYMTSQEKSLLQKGF